MPSQVESIVAQVKALPPQEQVQVAEAIDRLTWAHRWRQVCERIEAGRARQPVPSDEELQKLVNAVRREKPLSERSSTPRS